MKASALKVLGALLLIGICAIFIPLKSQFFGVVVSLILMALLLFWDDLGPGGREP
jgi:hypothetical protein